MQEALFGGGCFWCIEPIYQMLKGVISVESGYSGGDIENPSYEEVSEGNTGHVEVIKIIFDENIISFRKLLEVFFTIHDPTTLNRQGNDAGTQYKSAIFYKDDSQKNESLDLIKRLDNSGIYNTKIVTEVALFKNFYKAENYHQDYYNKNKTYPYCSLIISSKIEKFKNRFKELLKN